MRAIRRSQSILLTLLLLSTALVPAAPLRPVTLAYDYDWRYTLPDGRPAVDVATRGFRLYKNGVVLTTLGPEARSVTDPAADTATPTTYTLTAFLEDTESLPSNAVFILPAPAMVTAQWTAPPPPEPEPPPPPPNLLPTGDMEQAAWPSTAYGGSPAVRTWSTAQAHSGTHSLHATSTGLLWVGWQAPVVAVTPGATYTVRAWVQCQGITQGVTLHMNWLDAARKQVAWATVGARLQGTLPWTQLQGTLQAPTGATQARVEVRVQSEKGAVYVDDVVLIRGE